MYAQRAKLCSDGIVNILVMCVIFQIYKFGIKMVGKRTNTPMNVGMRKLRLWL